jgi:uncharacterized protein DUF1707
MTPRPDLRCSDAERDRVAAFLRDHAAEGRLTPDELDERVGAAYAAKTVRELQDLIADLPRPPLGPPSRRRRPQSVPPAMRNVPLVPLGILAFLALGGPGLVWATVLIGGAMALVTVALAIAIGAAASPFLLVALLVMLALRRSRRPARRCGWDPRWR